MASSALETYLTGIDPEAAPLVVALDDAVRAAHPGFSVAVKYKLLMYTLQDDWRVWVCAIDASRKNVGLRFLYGVILDDPLGVLRAGSSVLKTWDFPPNAVIDRAAVGAYVAEAVAKHARYKANSAAILAEIHAAEPTKPTPRPKPTA